MEEQQIPLEQTGENGKKYPTWIFVVLVPILLVGVSYFGWKTFSEPQNAVKPAAETSSSKTNSNQNSVASWQEQGVAVSGAYADADVVDLGNGSFRMYYAAEPEVSGFNGQLYSATSSDGVTWKEEGEVRQMATFPDVIQLSDGRWRMYFQNAGAIKSAISTDRRSWTDEAGVRIDKTESGFEIINVGAQSTTQLPDGSYLMVYRGMIDQKYSSEVPNNSTQLFFYATSTDGLTWQKKGVAIDSRDQTFYGLLDGAEWVAWDGNELRLYFWSYTGVYHSVYKDGQFSKPVFDFMNQETNSLVKFPPNPPGDPTLAKINGTWFMFYGQHTKGIYYAVLK